ncbi:MAG: type II toxin-antitoxin system PemK/MazF family toxin [Acidobacteria bacterium]|nr:type II toxin-antitoxin system PemK/MazF family toxin [Acidobacteriota bacterium]
MATKSDAYVPDAGDVIWLEFDPTRANEQRGRRPALVLSARELAELTQLSLVAPITSTVRGWPTQVELPNGLPISGAVMVEQCRAVNFVERRAQFACRAGATVLERARDVLAAIAGIR